MTHTDLNMDSIVISIGGSVVLADDIDISFFNKFADYLKEICKKYKIYIIVGGGKTARTYIKNIFSGFCARSFFNLI